MATTPTERRVPIEINEIKTQLAFEDALEPGDAVQARWTNSRNYYVARAEVVRVNRASVRIRLTEALEGAYGGYPVGQEFPVPLLSGGASTWSVNNCVRPLETTREEVTS